MKSVRHIEWFHLNAIGCEFCRQRVHGCRFARNDDVLLAGQEHSLLYQPGHEILGLVLDFPCQVLGDLGDSRRVVVPTSRVFGPLQVRESLVIDKSHRGIVGNHQALVAALRDGTVSSAIIDVHDPEPLPADSPLWHVPNLFLMPQTEAELLALPKEVFDTPDEMAAAGWCVD